MTKQSRNHNGSNNLGDYILFDVINIIIPLITSPLYSYEIASPLVKLKNRDDKKGELQN